MKMEYNLRNFIHQLIGKENLFGYRNRIINQLHQIYWFLGEFYHSHKFNRRITLIWKLCNFVTIALLIGHSLAYTFFSSNHNVIKSLFTLQVVTVTINLLITIPIGSRKHRHHIVEMFKILDQTSDLVVENMVIVPRQKFTSNHVIVALFSQMILFALYIICTYLDLVIGYHSRKLSDPNYYVYPTYSDHVQDLNVFLLLLSSQVFSAFLIGVLFFLVPVFPIVVMREFYLKFQNLCDFIDSRAALFGKRYERMMKSSQQDGEVDEPMKLQRSILHDIRVSAMHHHTLLSGISHMKFYLEFIMSMSLFNFIYIEILVVYIFTMMEEVSVLLKFKIVDYGIITAILLLVNCFVADSFANMGEMFRDSVYNIPWYYMPPASRKSVHLLLNQAQVVIEFRALKVHILGMGFFLQSCNSVYSIVNILRGRLGNV